MTTKEKEDIISRHTNKILAVAEPISKELYESMLNGKMTEKQMYAIKASIIARVKEEF